MIHLSVVSVCNNQIHEVSVICKDRVQWKAVKNYLVLQRCHPASLSYVMTESSLVKDW